MRLDRNDKFPSGMQEYLSFYGWHFSKRMEEWAASRMYKEVDGRKEKISPYTKSEVEEMIKRSGVTLEDGITYDTVYIANMVKADFLGSAIDDEYHTVLFIKAYSGDPDGYEGMPFTRFYADCIGSGTPIYWEDMI